MQETYLTRTRFGFRRRREMSANGLDDDELKDISTVVDNFERFVNAYETVLEQYGDALREIDKLKRENERLKHERKDKPDV